MGLRAEDGLEWSQEDLAAPTSMNANASFCHSTPFPPPPPSLGGWRNLRGRDTLKWAELFTWGWGGGFDAALWLDPPEGLWLLHLSTSGSSVAQNTVGTFLSQTMRHEDASGRVTDGNGDGDGLDIDALIRNIPFSFLVAFWVWVASGPGRNFGALRLSPFSWGPGHQMVGRLNWMSPP